MTGVLNARDDKRANKRKRDQSTYRGDDRSTFINYELTKDERAALLEWREDASAVVTVWQEVLDAGYKLNTKFDDYNDCYAAFIIPGDGADNQGYILPGRGGNPYRAVAESLFKHSAVFGGAWRVARANGRAENDSDF